MRKNHTDKLLHQPIHWKYYVNYIAIAAVTVIFATLTFTGNMKSTYPGLLEKIGIRVGDEVRCVICETGFEHDFVQHELMMPILPIVRVKDIDQAIDLAVRAEHGNRHTAHMHSKNIDNLTRFARAVETTIFVKNAPSYAGIGFGGEGHTTFTIAGPTGEGITSARSFTRKRRCVMVDSFRII